MINSWYGCKQFFFSINVSILIMINIYFIHILFSIDRIMNASHAKFIESYNE